LSSKVSDEEIKGIFTALSPARMSHYVRDAGSETRALTLYAWNAELSAALLVDIHYLEVVLRNAIYTELKAIVGNDASVFEALERERWFSQQSREDLAKARTRLSGRARPITEDGMIAELSFGFWRYLLTGKYHRVLWERGLWRAFPDLANAQDRRRDIEKGVRAAYELRNRIAHHEPVYARSVLSEYDDVVQVLGWLCATVRDWVASRSKVMSLATNTAGWVMK
jgi:hypothetical protein